MSEQADSTHTVPVQAVDGTAWYREPVAVLDLRDCETDRANVAKFSEQNYALIIPIAESRQETLWSWSEKRLGQRAAWMFNGKLMGCDTLHTKLREAVALSGFGSAADAIRALRELRGMAKRLDPRAPRG